jgi:hypothetical protein
MAGANVIGMGIVGIPGLNRLLGRKEALLGFSEFDQPGIAAVHRQHACILNIFEDWCNKKNGEDLAKR